MQVWNNKSSPAEKRAWIRMQTPAWSLALEIDMVVLEKQSINAHGKSWNVCLGFFRLTIALQFANGGWRGVGAVRVKTRNYQFEVSFRQEAEASGNSLVGEGMCRRDQLPVRCEIVMLQGEEAIFEVR